MFLKHAQIAPSLASQILQAAEAAARAIPGRWHRPDPTPGRARREGCGG